MTDTQTYGLKVQPYPYQCEGIAFGLERKRVLIGDEPGLGKTLQAIGIVNAADAWPTLVICPSSLKINWQREFDKFTGRPTLILGNTNATTWPYLLRMGGYCAAIVNYESLRKFFVWDIKGGKGFRLKDVVFNPDIRMFRSVIIDESHRVKDPGAQQTIFTKGICAGKERVILLSGTPVINRPQDLISQLSIMDRLKEFGGRVAFEAMYCTDPKKKDARPRVPLSDLSRRLYGSCLIRREKSKVLTQLPDKTRVDLVLDLNREIEKEYRLAEQNLREFLETYTDCTEWEIRKRLCMEALSRFNILRKLATVGKIDQAADFIATFLESGKKLIVFCHLHEVVDGLLTHFPKAVTLTGRESAAQKQAAVDTFQNVESVQLIICSVKAAGVGLTLTAASNVAFLELPWTYADCCQCEDRAHRIGQKDNVTCYYLLGRSTIDYTVYDLIYRKKAIAAEIMNGSDEIPRDEAYIEELINLFLKD